MTLLVYPTYFSPIIQYVLLAEADMLTFEIEDNFQKQTYRTRCYIYGANGRQLLNIPVKSANSKQQTKEVQIDYSDSWQKQHVKAIESAYRSSPFYEFYEDEVHTFFASRPKFLLDFNFKSQDLLLELLELNVSYQKTKTYEKEVPHVIDARFLANAKRPIEQRFTQYNQVFTEKHGFISNLSILDLLFNEGPNALNYLESQHIDFQTWKS